MTSDPWLTSLAVLVPDLVLDINTLSSLIIISCTSWNSVLLATSPNSLQLMLSSPNITERRRSMAALSFSSSTSRSELSISTTWKLKHFMIKSLIANKVKQKNTKTNTHKYSNVIMHKMKLKPHMKLSMVQLKLSMVQLLFFNVTSLSLFLKATLKKIIPIMNQIHDFMLGNGNGQVSDQLRTRLELQWCFLAYICNCILFKFEPPLSIWSLPQHIHLHYCSYHSSLKKWIKFKLIYSRKNNLLKTSKITKTL